MTKLTIRNVGLALKEHLRRRAALNRHSVEAELRRESNLAEAIRQRFLPFGGVDRLEQHPPLLVDTHADDPQRAHAPAGTTP